MISTLRRIVTSVAVCILASASYAGALQDASEASPIEALRALYNDNRQFRTTMDRAFAHMQDPDPETADLWPNPTDVNPWKGKEFDDLLSFFDEWYHLLPTPSGAQDEFNYIEKFAWFYYKNPYGQQIVGEDPGLSWTKDFVEARRKFLDSSESTATSPQWVDDPAIHIEQYIVPPGGFRSFNEFFVRELKPGTRTVASPTDDSVLVSPTDCVLNMINPLMPDVRIPTKLNQQLNVKELLAGSEYAKYFETGTAISCILLPTTHHHYHAMVSGKVVESREDVAGAYWGIEDFGTFYNAGNIGYGANYSAFEQFRRGYFVIQTDEYGYVAMIPVGLNTIGSVVFEDKYRNVTPQNPVPVYKGEKLGHFEYGGSLVITLVEQGISSISIPQGQQIGVFGQKKTQAPASTQVPPTEAPVAAESSTSSGTLAAASGPPITARMLVEPYALMGPGPSSFNWSPKGAILAYVEPLDGRDVLWAYDPATSEKWALLDPGDNPDQIDLSSAQWSPQGDLLLLSGGTALWLLDADTGELRSLGEGSAGITSLEFSPDGTRIAFVQDNDLYTIGVNDGKIVRLTTDGSETVFNGTLDWVYNEELATRSSQPAYAWSPDGRWLIYLRLDEAEVQNHSVTDYRSVPPTLSYTRYPVAGSANPKASLHMVALDSGRSSLIPLSADAEYVLPFFAWFPDSQEAVYVTVNRAHSSLELNAWNPTAGSGRTLVKETDPTWVNENAYAAPIFLGDGSQFLWLSERDGFMHLYLYSRQGELIRQLTEGEWMIDTPAWNLLIPGRPVYVDPDGSWAYFSCTKNSPLERQIYRVNITSGALEQVSQPAGFHFGALSGDGRYLVDQFSDVSTPPVTKILTADGTEVSVLGQSAGPTLELPEVTREFVTIKAHDGVDLYAQLVKPENFDPEREYPVIVHWYAGPTLQMVSNRYGKTNLFNHIERDVLYTQAGFIVWRLDNRGSFGRGHAFETPIAGELGKAALDDQLAGIEYLQTLPYIDASRIGCDGKSFGGYMTLYALIHAPDVFKAGVAGSAPTRWEYYDTIYTERYMGTPSENPEGYAATDLIAAADQLQARPLIIHGLDDTNVHLQNSINLIQELEALDKPFDFLPLPNLNHSYRGDGLVTALSASVDHFVRYLGNE